MGLAMERGRPLAATSATASCRYSIVASSSATVRAWRGHGGAGGSVNSPPLRFFARTKTGLSKDAHGSYCDDICYKTSHMYFCAVHVHERSPPRPPASVTSCMQEFRSARRAHDDAELVAHLAQRVRVADALPYSYLGALPHAPPERQQALAHVLAAAEDLAHEELQRLREERRTVLGLYMLRLVPAPSIHH